MFTKKNAEQIKVSPDFTSDIRISQGFTIGDLIILSGQVARNEKGIIVGNNIQEQAKQIFKNIDKILTSLGSSLNKIIKVTIYVLDISDFAEIVNIRKRYFSPPYPADTLVEVKSLAAKEMLIEVEAIALIKGEVL